MPKQKIIFLDRDGIINQPPTVHRYVTKWEEFEFNPEIFSLLKNLTEKGYRLVIITNQQGIGKGEYSEETLSEIHTKMQQRLSEEGVEIDKIEHCPHLASDNCACRKPKAGMFYTAMNELNYTIDVENSYFIGDSISDMIAGRAFGCQTILVGPQADGADVQPDYRVDNLLEIKKLFL